MSGSVIVCGGSGRLEPRDECPDPLHDYPMPMGYVDAGYEASRRLGRHWRNVKCKRCGYYGWAPPMGGAL